MELPLSSLNIHAKYIHELKDKLSDPVALPF